MTERPNPGTDWLALADRLDELATDRRWDCWNKHGDGSLDVPEGYDPSPDCCDAADGANALRAAADGLRQYAAITAERDQLRAERTQLTGDSMTDLKMTYAYEAGHEDGKAEVREQLDAITAAIDTADGAQFARLDAERTKGEWVHRDVTQFVAGWDEATARLAASLTPTPTPDHDGHTIDVGPVTVHDDRCPTCGHYAWPNYACPDAWHNGGGAT